MVSSSFSYPAYLALRDHNEFFQTLFAFKHEGLMTATIDGHAETARGELVSGNFYSGMQVNPAVGRAISEHDDSAGIPLVAVISDSFWARRFGRANKIVGKVIDLNRVPVTIIGINPPGFTGIEMGRAPDIFLPMSAQPTIFPQDQKSLLENPDHWGFQILGRVKPGVSDLAIQNALDIPFSQKVRADLSKKSTADMPHLRVLPGNRGIDDAKEEYITPIYVLACLVVFVLLIACANLANLLLARAAARQREMSVRIALGASKMRVVRQVLTESMLLSFLGGAGGVVLGYLTRNTMPNLIRAPWEAIGIQAHFDWVPVAFTVLLSLLAGVVFGIAPALQASGTNMPPALKDGAKGLRRGVSSNLAGKLIVVFQIAVSLMLIFGAGLFLQTLRNLHAAPLGFNPDRILLFDISAPGSRYSPAAATALHQRLEQTIAQVPGVKSVTLSLEPLVAGDTSTAPFKRNDHPKNETEQPAWVNAVGDQFFQTMQIPIFTGRAFNEHDTATSPKVAIINQRLAREFFPHENPIGKTFNDDRIQIVGICGDTRYENLKSDPPASYFIPYTQQPWSDMTYEVQTAGQNAGILKSLQQAIGTVDKDLPLINVRTQTQQIEATLSGQRMFATLTSAFGVLALILACIGIYGIMAYSVTRRTNEIGIRMALGAPRAKVLHMILRESSAITIAGIILGIGAALLLARLVSSMLYGLKSSDPLVLSSAALILLSVALLAGWLPAHRASRVDLIEALRHE